MAVVGLPDDHYGEEVAAVIVLASGQSVTGEEVRVWAKEQLSAYKVPRLFQFVEGLPKGASGKILKRGIDLDGLAAQSAARKAQA